MILVSYLVHGMTILSYSSNVGQLKWAGVKWWMFFVGLIDGLDDDGWKQIGDTGYPETNGEFIFENQCFGRWVISFPEYTFRGLPAVRFGE